MDRLKRAISDAGHDLDHERYHFVLLINTVRTAGAGSQWSRDVVGHLLRRYLTDGDHVSIAPYQLNVRPEAVWDEPFARATADTVYKRIPLLPELPVTGHDTERAVMEAVSRLGSPSSAIYITLSDSEASQRPGAAPKLVRSTLVEWTAMLDAGHLREAGKGRIEGIAHDAQRRPHTAVLYYRLYLPSQLQPLATGIKRPPPPPIVIVEPPRIVESPGGKGKDEPPPRVPWLPIVALAVCVGGLGGYSMWLRQPKGVRVHFAGHDHPGVVRLGTATLLGGPGCKGVELPDLKEGTKLGELSVTGTGKVILRARAPYSIASPQEPVIVDRAHKRIVVRRTDDSIALEIWRT
jgi:hypothetical protein